MIMTPVESTTLAGAAYDAPAETLHLAFCDGTTYRYFGVPSSIYVELLSAKSKGSYFNNVIRRRFSYERSVKSTDPRPPDKSA